MRSHVNSKYAWTDVFFGPNQEAVHLIDKQTLEVAHTLRPMPGKNAAHVEFTNDGSHLILSVWGQRRGTDRLRCKNAARSETYPDE